MNFGGDNAASGRGWVALGGDPPGEGERLGGQGPPRGGIFGGASSALKPPSHTLLLGGVSLTQLSGLGSRKPLWEGCRFGHISIGSKLAGGTWVCHANHGSRVCRAIVDQTGSRGLANMMNTGNKIAVSSIWGGELVKKIGIYSHVFHLPNVFD